MKKCKKLLKNILAFSLVLVIMMTFFSFAGVRAENEAAATLRDIYIPKTQFVAPTVIMRVESQEDISAARAEKRAAVALMKLDADLNVIGSEGAPLFSVNDVYGDNGIGEGIIPAYVVSEEAEVAAKKYFSEANILDGLLFSEDFSIVSSLREGAPTMRGGVIVDDITSPSGIASQAIANNAGVVLVPACELNKDIVNALHNRWISVWANCSENREVYQALAAGVDGIIVESPAEVIDLLETLPVSLFREPMLQAHRGVPDRAQENTVSGALLAAEAGADNMELDVYYTKDGRLAVIHDGELTNLTNGTGNVGDYTLEELRQMYVDVNPYVDPEPLPSLEDFFRTFESIDFSFTVEIKQWEEAENERKIVQQIKSLAEQYNMMDRMLIVSFVEQQIKFAREEMPSVPALWLSGSVASDTTDMKTYLESTIKNCNRIDIGGINSGDLKVTEEHIAQLAARGIMTTVGTYTLGSYDAAEKRFVSGVSMMTSNDVVLASDFAVALEPIEEKPNLGIGVNNARPIFAYIVTKSGYLLDETGQRRKVVCDVVSVDGEIKENAEGCYVENNGAYDFLLRWKSPMGYYIYSDLMTVWAGDLAINIDYTAETVSFDDNIYEISNEADFLTLLSSGQMIEPGSVLYVRTIGENRVWNLRIPNRPAAPQASYILNGKTLTLSGGTQYRICGGQWTDSGLYIGIEHGRSYSFGVRIAATANSFASEESILLVSV